MCCLLLRHGGWDGMLPTTRTTEVHPLDPWRVANLLIEQHGESAGLQAALRADALWEVGDEAGVAVWRQVLGAIDILQRTEQLAGEAQH